MLSTSDYGLLPLRETHDLKLVCRQCCVKKREITYALRLVDHECAYDILLCKVKGGSIWRPVSKRPSQFNPSQYKVCMYFKEGSGCMQHRDNCTFARSDEEAAVWTFEKNQGLDDALLCNLVAMSEQGPNQSDNGKALDHFRRLVDLKVVCELCSAKERDISYTIKSVLHKCGRSILLAKAKASKQWRPVSKRPFHKNILYKVCIHFVEGSGCTEHGHECTYARSCEEATVWNFLGDRNINENKLMRLLTESEPPQQAAEYIIQQFPGKFTELCKECFNKRPQKLSGKRWNDTCTSDAAHKWKPVLVYHTYNKKEEVFSQIRPLPPNCKFECCSHVRKRKPCWHEPGHCHSAQSEVELVLWEAENSGFEVQSFLLQLSEQEQAKARNVPLYCKVCHLTLSTPESFYHHCTTPKHAQLLSEDTTTEWRGRPPPHTCQAELWLCNGPENCKYGINCPKAHSEEELQEWMMRAAKRNSMGQISETFGHSYIERVLEEYRNSSNEEYIMSEQVDDVCISCDQELTVKCDKGDTALTWNFHVETPRPLIHVALLKQEPGASFFFSEDNGVPCIYSSGKCFLTEDNTYSISVYFKSSNPGLYKQWIVLDFDMRPVLLRKIKVIAGQQSVKQSEEPTINQGATILIAERWHRGNKVIIPCSTRFEEQEELLTEYEPAQVSSVYMFSSSRTPLNGQNYKERMHHFLYDEEQAEDQIVSRLNLQGEILTKHILYSTQSGMMVAPPQQLFGAVSMPCNLTMDTPEGTILKQSVHFALISTLTTGHQNSKVYEASIMKQWSSKNKLHLLLSKQCCVDLRLKGDESYQMEVQFQLERLKFCNMHKAVDLLQDTKNVIPDLQNCRIPDSNTTCEKLNTRQQSAIAFITGKTNDDDLVAPFLIYGPFGTGKTLTLATAARELCNNPLNKVLICTHTNSSADLYVREHLHPFLEKNNNLKIMRIKASKQGKAKAATDEITSKYCHFIEDDQKLPPQIKQELDCHNIVITTTTVARYFQDLKLPDGYFTHLLIDEASQMLECEALMAINLAGPNTRVVLAGDHMQIRPKLFSNQHSFDCSLLTRLFHLYQGQNCDAAQNSRIIFNENYRSTKEIVEFVSTNFYSVKNDIIKDIGNVPPPPNGHALQFHHVRGECILDDVSLTWYNMQEVTVVVETVTEILDSWPLSWGPKDSGSICVLSEGLQVRLIRKMLLERHLSQVCVENLANVQGKEFRAVIITAVQTRDSLKTANLQGLELFNNACVLNTAMTRAQSLVVIVGDAVALSCSGKCSRIWKNYFDHCLLCSSVKPQNFSKEVFNRDVKETTRFQKAELDEESNNLSDEILQELKKEYEQEYEEMQEDYNSDRTCSEFEDTNDVILAAHISQHADEDKNVLELCEKLPETYMPGQFVMTTYRTGYVIPRNSQNKQISIEGKKNLGKAFTGDEVVVCVEPPARVISITTKSESARVLLCQLEEEDHTRAKSASDNKHIRKMMVPITGTETKICILINKKTQNFIPIWKQNEEQWEFVGHKRFDVNLKYNSLFLVQVIGWKDTCLFPLGKVIDIIPISGSLSNELGILKKELKITTKACKPKKVSSLVDKNKTHRQDMRDVITFTVDPVGAKDLDDAISVQSMGDRYKLGVHIADVASFVIPGSNLDANARQRGSTYYNHVENHIHMFAQTLSTGIFSLLPGEDRGVVSLIFTAENKTNKIIGKPTFQFSLIKSDKQLSYEEADVIITQKKNDNVRFDTVEDCVTAAYSFAKGQRKTRLKDWKYSQPDKERLPGRRKAHLMIEELSVLFNRLVSETLTASEKTKSCTPLCCQEKPNHAKMKELVDKFGKVIPLSFHLRHKVKHNGQRPGFESFFLLRSVWEDICSAVETKDTDKMIDLIAADDIHPQLQPAINQFKGCNSKGNIVCSNSLAADVGHYSLNLMSYTKASSPIRRYMDIIVQRLIHSVISDENVPYTQKEIMTMCREFEENHKKAKRYQQKSEQIFYAVSMIKHSVSKLAFVVQADSEGNSFAVAFPLNNNIFAGSLLIMYRDLQVEDQPVYDEENDNVTLKWKKFIITANKTKPSIQTRGPCVELPLSLWKATIEAVEKENWPIAISLIEQANTKQLKNDCKVSQTKTDNGTQEMPEAGNLVNIDLSLEPGNALQVQITSEVKRGYHMPILQLVQIKPNFEICVDHVRNCVKCFSRCADYPSKLNYRDTEQYVKIWKPLCDMESAVRAVGENNSIIIENMLIKFTQVQKGTLRGSISIPKEWMTEWANEQTFKKSFLCIRKRGIKITSTVLHSPMLDPQEFTWIAHGLIIGLEKQKHGKSLMNFNINHLPMETIPQCVFQKNTCFTVEIIPKLPPDIREESAVVNIQTACDLVQAVALGMKIQTAVNTTFQDFKMEQLKGTAELNESQNRAVNAALNDSLTLIQGPPGTGKTVVGVHIVFHFHQQNSKNQREFVDAAGKSKKEVILYCGPSNKSVDVVAEQLLKLGGRIKPLRVYSQRVEMLEYPYPDNTLQRSQSRMRQDRSKAELKSITLHHRIRQEENIHSANIKEFDKHIQQALENKEKIPANEIKKYKRLLNKARAFEYEHHDIILCTCTESSNPTLIDTVNARQILIDECAMATEPQALIPLVCNKPEKVCCCISSQTFRFIPH
ncbi:helicase with zinc finger domain 2-like isoform X2 [Gouania willdenowi]|uniref:helicase with zinc finger domain 2-like isoform X2 n=1 Tax=Gouania willdenowi TaxID=441366 RepID=UPI001054B37B|nr:helicase with zinc finger domain 2-like isoform X2 [Gouania willdenowi]